MSTTPGYGETPVGSGPEQPEWLRKAPGAPTSGGAPQAAYPAPQAAYPAPQTPYPAPQTAYPAQYQYPAQAQGQYQAPYAAPGPGAYPPPGSPWAPVDPHAKSRLAAGLLGIFLGTFGVHRFYLGYTRVGLTMLLMTLLSFGFLGLITSVWGLVEGILYLTDKTGRYSRDATGRPLRD